jgi:hypothetical protein
MAVIVFAGSDQVTEAQAIISILSMWLKEMPDVETPRPAKARFVYGSNGVARLIVEVEPAPPAPLVDEK